MSKIPKKPIKPVAKKKPAAKAKFNKEEPKDKKLHIVEAKGIPPKPKE